MGRGGEEGGRWDWGDGGGVASVPKSNSLIVSLPRCYGGILRMQREGCCSSVYVSCMQKKNEQRVDFQTDFSLHCRAGRWSPTPWSRPDLGS